MNLQFTNEKQMEECLVEYLLEKIKLINDYDRVEFHENFFLSNKSIVNSQVNLEGYGIADIVIITPNSESIEIHVLELKNRAINLNDFEQLTRYMVGFRCITEDMDREFEISGSIIGCSAYNSFANKFLKDSIYYGKIVLDSLTGIKIDFSQREGDWILDNFSDENLSIKHMVSELKYVDEGLNISNE